MRRLLAFVLLVASALAGWLALDVATARPASAHAALVSTTPSEGARLGTAPAEVTLAFSEGVDVSTGYARVLDADGDRVDTGSPTEADGVVTIPLQDGLPDDGYVVTYRVVSEDAHPIAGAYSFVVGDGELVDAGSVVGGDDVDPGVAVALPLARWLGFAGMALGIGVPVFLLLCWPAGWSAPLMRRLTTGGLVTVAVGAVLAFLGQGAYAAGAGLGSLLDPSLVGATAGSGYGIAVLFRLLCALALVALVRLGWRGRGVPTARFTVAFGILAMGVIIMTAAVGHPVAGPLPGVAVTSAAVHGAAMAVWLGGLTALLTGLLRPGAPAGDLAVALPRYSRMAFASVTALVVTGVVQSVREVGVPTALVTTTYGWLLLAKVALVLVLLAAAGVSRVWVQQNLGVAPGRPGRRRVTAHAFAAAAGGSPPEPTAGDGAPPVGRTTPEDVGPVRRSVLVEVAIAAVVLALSAVLVGTPPARSSVTQPVNVTVPLQGDAGAEAPGAVQITVDPAGTGPNTLHVFLLDETGQPAQPRDIRATLTEDEQQIGPLEVQLAPNGPGDYIGEGMSIPTAGTWTLTVDVRLDEFTATSASTEFRVR